MTTTLKTSVNDKIDSLRDSLSRAQKQLGDFYEDARDKVADGAKATDRTIRDYPYQSLGIAFGAGLLLGLFVRRRR